MMACASACPDGPAVTAALHAQLLSASQNTSGATDIYQNGKNARQNGHVLSLRVSCSAAHEPACSGHCAGDSRDSCLLQEVSHASLRQLGRPQTAKGIAGS